MATWDDLSGYIKDNYDIAGEAQQQLIQLGFRLSEERTHMVVVSLTDTGDGHPWAQIESPIGPIEAVDLRLAAELVGDALCGGLVAHHDMLLIRHAVPLPELDVHDFEAPLRVVVSTADALELRFTGGDDY